MVVAVVADIVTVHRDHRKSNKLNVKFLFGGKFKNIKGIESIRYETTETVMKHNKIIPFLDKIKFIVFDKVCSILRVSSNSELFTKPGAIFHLIPSHIVTQCAYVKTLCKHVSINFSPPLSHFAL